MTSQANTAKGVVRFVEELLRRLERTGRRGRRGCAPTRGLCSTKPVDTLAAAGWLPSIGARTQKPIRTAVEAIHDDAWTVLADYPRTGVAQIAETTFEGRRLIVRRVGSLGAQDEMFPDWRHVSFFTSRSWLRALAPPG